MTTEFVADVVAKPATLIEELRAEKPDLFRKAIQFTDEIAIPIPTQEQAKAIQETEDPEDMVRIMFGDQFDAVEAYCASLPVGAGVVALAKLVEAIRASLPDLDLVFAEYGIDKGEIEAQFAAKLKTKAE
ncbi:hypothetical protein SEA_OCTOBIEN14_25 [Gordonia phage Octobien14]|uniref:Uncharacterized protein n=1 Tax=Gordonia phage Octobien14 TaxID=2483673 RepID=A0A3G3M9N1_9CAUD|nr:hypothetical protein L3Y22_gp025 [Gordonia phage Octobien14]AYR03173.1 hypothetical protein SEA_OCTOBIEN14_25 [Gordonia phage Octobien14]